MKKLVGLFLWFCAATFVAQLCILGLAAYKGNVNAKTISQVVALLNGMDVQSVRFKEALISSRAMPTPSYQDVLSAKTEALLQQDSRGRALDTYQRRLDDSQRKLEEDIKRFDQRREEFRLAVENKKAGVDTENLGEMQRLLEQLEPEGAKTQLLKMLETGSKADVVAIIRGMSADKQKKVLGEFTQPEDQEKLAEILREIRNGEPLKSLLDNAQSAKP
jgi:hypothetical protein